MDQLSTFAGLLTALLFPVFLINYVVNNYLNTQPRWTSLTPGIQKVYEILSGIVISGAAYAAIHFLPDIPPNVLATINGVYPLFYAIISAFLGSQVSNGVFAWGKMRAARLKHLTQTYTLQFAPINKTTGNITVTNNAGNSERREFDIKIDEVG